MPMYFWWEKNGNHSQQSLLELWQTKHVQKRNVSVSEEFRLNLRTGKYNTWLAKWFAILENWPWI